VCKGRFGPAALKFIVKVQWREGWGGSWGGERALVLNS